MKSNKIKIIIVLLLFTASIITASTPVSVPVTDPVYGFLERMETLGYVHDLLDGVRPFSRKRVAAFLLDIKKHRAELTHIDRRRLDDYLLDYRYEIDPEKKYGQISEEQTTLYSPLAGWKRFTRDFRRFFQQNHPEEQNYVFLWEDGGNTFYFNFDMNLTYESRSDNLQRTGSWQDFLFRGQVSPRFGYQLNVSLQAVRGNDAYTLEHPILKGTWSQRPDKSGPRYADRTGGELVYHTKYIDLTFAQQEIQWGMGESGRLILSRNPEQYPYIGVTADWGWGKFIAIQGKLLSFPQDTLSDGTEIYPDKWLAAHRLEISPWNWLTLGLNENFIYGQRYMDWAYLFPLNFYRSVEHKLRDRDNATISIDLELLPYQGAKVYGTVFLDEFKASKLGTNWYGNKHAFSAGFYQVDPFGIPNFSLRLEYTAIMPWVYTHKFNINRYTSDYRSLGHWAGPNSEIWYLHIRQDLHQRFYLGLKLRQWKHGANYPNENIGGDILLGHGVLLGDQTEPRETSTFLEGILTTQRKVQFYAVYEVFNGLFLRAHYNIYHTNTEGEINNFNELFLGLKFRY